MRQRADLFQANISATKLASLRATDERKARFTFLILRLLKQRCRLHSLLKERQTLTQKSMKVQKVAIHISIQRIVQLVSLILILWIAIYPVDSRLSSF